jgi:hypothetical protein
MDGDLWMVIVIDDDVLHTDFLHKLKKEENISKMKYFVFVSFQIFSRKCTSNILY